MKQAVFLLFGILGLSACRLAQQDGSWKGPVFEDIEEQDTVVERTQKEVKPVTVETILGPEEQTKSEDENAVPVLPIALGFDERIAHNVRVKSSDKHGITYEYKNVRIDEIAHLASDYCYTQGEKQAFLYDSQLFRNFSRRATFHCRKLQK